MTNRRGPRRPEAPERPATAPETPRDTPSGYEWPHVPVNRAERPQR